MILAENGKFDIQVQNVGRDEIGSLSRSFNAMITKINNLINEVYVEKINQSQLELQMLQAQINPHFLYNTLESILSVSYTHLRSLGRRIAEAEEIRHASDYDDFYIATKEEAEEQIATADELIDQVERYVQKILEEKTDKL